ncbi:hypothetical protein [Alkalicoccobacillus gibsonii]|uniref:hypothetical protein n=1 Tax=Alkalicoccobacillus gibsonii TaxID=79881 RepID=UPI0019332DD4|nr:hypothetical protein [Alkalicoccobacillus gibsonii]MBM0064762.1 hypothetical protein [Alkalicoccobacillus gibsonii]
MVTFDKYTNNWARAVFYIAVLTLGASVVFAFVWGVDNRYYMEFYPEIFFPTLLSGIVSFILMSGFAEIIENISLIKHKLYGEIVDDNLQSNKGLDLDQRILNKTRKEEA